jgi:hypothetical protein
LLPPTTSIPPSSSVCFFTCFSFFFVLRRRCNHFVDGIIASGALSQSRRADFLGDCSRHKSTHKNAEVDTPEQYWNLSFQDSQDHGK